MWFRMVRDVALLLGGLGIAVHEVLYVTDPRLPILGLAAAMLGLPGFLITDRKLQDTSPSPDDDEDEDTSHSSPISHRRHS